MTNRADNTDPTAVRAARSEDYAPLAQLWYDTWHETQAAGLPDELKALRTLPDFERRLRALGDDLKVFGPRGAPVAFCATTDTPDAPEAHGTAELYQLFASPAARGTGAAAVLMEDAECRLIAKGHKRAHLKCLADNVRALRFYEKCGWRNVGVQPVSIDTSDGPMQIDGAVLIKDLKGGP
ncbi:MAG: GNAT family N-acetyltransferase [Pseudomonadota bacterium]